MIPSQDNPAVIHDGDCVRVMGDMSPGFADAVVTDPPYEIGLFSKPWDSTNVAFNPATWAAVSLVCKPGAYLLAFGATRTYHRLACAVEDAGFVICDCVGWVYATGMPKGLTCLKPAWEPILLARNPGPANHLGIDACRAEPTGDRISGGIVGGKSDGWNRPWKSDPDSVSRKKERAAAAYAKSESLGRYPSNLVHDGSDEVTALFPGSGTKSAARFFYCPKPSKTEKAGNDHPTVKPLELMKWLVRLVAKPGETVFDPFGGSGTTGVACREESRLFVMCDDNPEYTTIAKRRLRL